MRAAGGLAAVAPRTTTAASRILMYAHVRPSQERPAEVTRRVEVRSVGVTAREGDGRGEARGCGGCPAGCCGERRRGDGACGFAATHGGA